MPESSFNQMVQWLAADWVDGTESIGVLQGFEGLGKSGAAAEFQKAWDGTRIFFSVPPEADLDEVLLGVGSSLEDAGIHTMTDSANWLDGLSEILRDRKVLLILDDFEHLLDPNRQIGNPEFRRFANALSRSRGQGRLLLVSNFAPAPDDWLDRAAVRTARAMSDGEGAEFLSKLLTDQHLETEVPLDLRTDICSWLANNPRAIRAFVSCLAGEPLDNIISFSQDTWDLRDEPPSRELLQSIERRFWSRTIGRFDPSTLALAENLSVYRRPFKADAIESAGGSLPRWQAARDALVGAFALDRTQAYYSINPIVRQLAASSLNRQRRREIAAHSRAAEHFARRTGTTYRDVARAGAAFIEARYHYGRAGLENSVHNLVQQFKQVALPAMAHSSFDHRDPRIVREMTPVLLATLTGSTAPHYRLRASLVLLLHARGRHGDDVLALQHATIASQGKASREFWMTYIDIAESLESDLYLSRIADRLIRNCDGFEGPLSRLAQALWRHGAIDAALAALDSGLVSASEEMRVYLLSVRAFLLARSSRIKVALEDLESAYVSETKRSSRHAHRVFEEACVLALQFGSGSDLRRLEDLADKLPTELRKDSRVTYARVLQRVLQGDYRTAADEGAHHLDYPAIAAQVAFSRLVVGDPAGAASALTGIGRLSNRSNDWLVALVALANRDADTYLEFIGRASRKPLTDADVEDPSLWLRVWDEIPDEYGSYPAYYYPRLPAELTGLSEPLIRTPQSGSQYDLIAAADPRVPVTPAVKQSVPGTAEVSVDDVGRASVVINVRQESGMSDTYNVYGQAGYVGRDGKLGENTNQQGVSVTEVLLALDVLREQAARSGNAEIAAVLTAARDEEQRGDRPHAVERLRAIAQWIGDKAGDAAAGVAAGTILALIG
ncbi:hypothetical protein [Microbacterium sp. JZ31]|uniref:hypothetical protein n=1 Tax=Microbacterium sp. JZ31 TaxID=1906274 RepID=UPI0019348E72|nr:hypothetical protein [Microbacterium sp. JZ31]